MSVPESVRLSSVAEIVQGGRLKLSGNDFVDVGFPAYGAGGLNGYLEAAEFNRPAIVLSSIGARCGKCFYVEGEWTSLANTQLIFPDLAKVDPKYLWYQLNDESSWVRSGTAQPFIKPSNVKSRLVRLPELAEQRRIAALLDKADTLRAKRREAIAKLDQLLQSVFIDMFGDPTANPKGLPVRSLGELTTEIYRYPTYYDIEYEEDGVPEVRGEMISGDGTIDASKARYISHATSGRFTRTQLAAGDLVMSVRGTIGKVGLVSTRLAGANMTANLIRISPDLAKLDPNYLWRYAKGSFFAKYVDRVSASTTIRTIKAPDLKALPVLLPAMSEQSKFVTIQQRILDLAEVAIKGERGVDLMYSALQAKAFSGEI